MKVVTTNLLNRLWKHGVIPIKDAVASKFDTSKIVKSANITEEGFVMDGKMASELYSELIGKLPGDFFYTSKSMSVQNGVSIVLYEEVLKGGVYLVLGNFDASVSSNATLVASLIGNSTCTIRGTMGGGGGLSASLLVDARESDITVKARATHTNSSAVNLACRYSRIRLA